MYVLFHMMYDYYIALCRILVLDQGHVEEFDTPTKLLEQQNTIFYSMMMNAGLI